MAPLAVLLATLALQPPAWIQRAGIPGTIVTWRAADVLGTPVAEGIVVGRDSTARTLTVAVVDSRFDPPRIVRLRELSGQDVVRLRAGRRDHLERNEIRVTTEKATYVLRVRTGFALRLLRTLPG
jgi:hypothetical protein